jgi:hypothetical protein
MFFKTDEERPKRVLVLRWNGSGVFEELVGLAGYTEPEIETIEAYRACAVAVVDVGPPFRFRVIKSLEYKPHRSGEFSTDLGEFIRFLWCEGLDAAQEHEVARQALVQARQKRTDGIYDKIEAECGAPPRGYGFSPPPPGAAARQDRTAPLREDLLPDPPDDPGARLEGHLRGLLGGE